MNTCYAIGVDIGGTNTVIGVVDAQGNILYRSQISTINYASGEEYTVALATTVNELIRQNNLHGKIKSIGIGAPGGNMNNGTLEKVANIPWAKTVRVPLCTLITAKTGLSCKLTNDANAAALGEMIYGSAKGMKDFIVVTLGTGMGSGIVSGGELIVGHNGYAGELGHSIIVRHNGRLCGCGRTGCLETYVSATGVARTAREFLELYPDNKSTLRTIVCRPITSKDVFEAARNDDELALKIFDFTGKILGDAICDFITFSNPQAIILFGGLAHAGDYLLKPLCKEIDKQILNVFNGKTEILISQLNNAEAAILGASALAWK